MTPLLELRGVSKSFPVPAPRRFLRRAPPSWLRAVADVSLSILPGEALGLVGESGCGKSTLARIVARLIDADAGEVILDGEVIGAVPPGRFATHPARRAVQMVFQDPAESLNPRFSAFDAIADPVRLLRPGDAAAVRARVERAAASVGLPPELLPRLPHQLSGGQKARVGLARAMAVEPRLLLLDEPTSALDVSAGATVLRLLARLRRETGVALLFVSHDLNVVRLLCDRVAVMYLGQVVESGVAREVFRAPRHPYTRALLSAVPRLPGAPRPPRERLEGEPRSPVDPDPNACRLLGRCAFATELCGRVAPRLEEVAPGRLARCHHPVG